MRSASRDSRVAMVGASSLLGKEILNVLKERGFPASQVSELSAEGGAPEIPILDVDEEPLPLVQDESREVGEYDFIFLASRAQSAEGKRWLHERFEKSAETAPAGGRGAGHWVIDAAGCVSTAMKGRALSVPSLDPRQDNLVRAASEGSRLFASPHAAAIVISQLLLRLAASLSVQRAVVEVFNPASELGPEAIDELQKQTVSLLSFQQFSQDFFGAQTAFNMIPRLGGEGRESFLDLEERIRQELKQILTGQAPAVRLVQSPVFYSLAFSLYVETAHGLTAAKVEQALAGAGTGARVQLLRASQPAPSPVEAQGSSVILVDPIVLDRDRPGAFWLWAMADNLRLTAENAVEIAEALQKLKYLQ